MKVLVVEDDERLKDILLEILRMEGYEPFGESTGEAVLSAVQSVKPEIILLDQVLPDKTGIQVLREIRVHNDFADVPVIMLTADHSYNTMVEAYNHGVDDYVTKPFVPTALLGKIKSLSLRAGGPRRGRKSYAAYNLNIDLDACRATIRGQPIQLTLTEFKILAEIASNASAVTPRQDLQKKVFSNATVTKRTLDVHICALRKKIKPFDLQIETVRSLGYLLSVKDAANK